MLPTEQCHSQAHTKYSTISLRNFRGYELFVTYVNDCNKNSNSTRAATVAVECRSLFYQHTASSTDLAPCHSVYS